MEKRLQTMHTTVDISDAGINAAIIDICRRRGFTEQDFVKHAIENYIEYNMAPGRRVFGLFRNNPIDIDQLKRDVWDGVDDETSSL